MHMLRDEDNAKYRQVMKNTLEFDPQVLKRYVNFMNNPDEKTAIEQFGNGDKYFGVATLMTTLPGLPMIGHGQIEGFREKYGMEYRRAYWDEHPDEGLVAHHERIIYPLMRRRYLFADVENFLLYDVFTPEGHVNEDVFAYSNGPATGSGQAERALIVYHNKYAETRGWIKMSVGFMDKANNQIVQKTLGEGLNLRGGMNDYIIFRDVNSGLEFIRPSRELVEKGLYVELSAYKCHAFVDFKEVTDVDGKWKAVHEALNGAGYWAIQAKFDEMFKPVVEEVKEEKPKKTRKKATSKKVAEKKMKNKKAAGEKKETEKKPRASKKVE
jgi:hypothetical protein